MKWENKKFIDFIQLQRGHDLTREQFIDGGLSSCKFYINNGIS